MNGSQQPTERTIASDVGALESLVDRYEKTMGELENRLGGVMLCNSPAVVEDKPGGGVSAQSAFGQRLGEIHSRLAFQIDKLQSLMQRLDL